MLDDVLRGLQNLDAKRASEVVEQVWEDREKIPEVVNFVWDQRDELTAVLTFFAEHKEGILLLLHELPKLLEKAGAGLAQAGDGALRASAFLLGEAGDGARDVAVAAAKALDTCRDELDGVIGLIERLGSSLDDVTIPSFAPQFTDVGGYQVMTGVDVGEDHVLGDVVRELSDGAKRVAQIMSGLEGVSERFRGLGDVLDGAGKDLGEVGQRLKGSGATLQALTASTATGPAPRRTARQRGD